MNANNTNFPRGGNKIPLRPTKRKHNEYLFQIEHSQEVKKVRKSNSANNSFNNEDWQMSLKLHGTLAYNKIEDGMLILGCVKHITNLSLKIEFPGLTFGIVTINQISDSFNEILSKELKQNHHGSYEKSLRNMIQVGQLMPAKIISVTKTDKGHEVQASTNPRDINSNKKHYSFKKGQTIWVNVVSEQDHGYELTVGVKNCRVFLPFKNLKNDKKYNIGEPLYCVVYQVETSSSATILTVSTKEQTNKFHIVDLTLNDIIPGMQINFVVEQISPHGIRGRFLDNCFGYIDETQIPASFDWEKLKVGTTIATYVLFVEPVTKVTYFTMHGLFDLQKPQLQLGEIISAKIISCVPGGLSLQLGKNGDLGFATNKRLLNTLPKDAQLNVIQAVRNKYPPGSQHDCRILDFNYMQQLYICTLEKQVIKEKIFNVKDLFIGQIIKVSVVKIFPNGLTVKSGQIQGYVPNIHISNSKYNETIKAKFHPGMKVDARVFNITDEGNVIFTLKQSLIESKECLSHMEDAQLNSQYVGIVVQTKTSGALVAFYGNVKGWITDKTLNSDNPGTYMDPRDYFFIGQVVLVWIAGCKNNKLLVSLKPRKQEIQLGENANGKVVSVDSDNIRIIVGRKKIEAIVPVAHLCSHLHLAEMIKNIYQPGDEITNLMCIKNTDEGPVMSRRESIAHKKKILKIYKIKELKKNMIVRCSFEEETELGIFVSAPIKDYSEHIFIAKKKFKGKKGKRRTFKAQQCILCKIVNVDFDEKKIDLSVLPESSLNKDPTYVIDSLAQIMEDVEFATKLYMQKHQTLRDFNVGNLTKCTIEKIDDNGDHFVTLLNGARGMIPEHLAQPHSKVGQVIDGVLLNYNFSNNCVELCSKSKINQKINKVQDGIIAKSLNASTTARILLVSKYYMLGILSDKNCNKQLIYLPAESQLKPNTCLQKMKVLICRKVGNKIIGLNKKFGLKLNKMVNQEEKHRKPNKEENTVNSSETDVVQTSEEDVIIESTEENEAETKEHEDISESVQTTAVSNVVENKAELQTTPTEEPQLKFDDAENSKINEVHDTGVNIESLLSGTQSFYISKDESNIPSDSSSDSDEEEKVRCKKKKKMSAQERDEAVRKEEERIANIEKQLIDIPTIPQSAEQFDRQLLANPNSSELWLQYMSMHIAAAELDKARVVGKRAIERINMTLIKEKFNIWIALLNLENMYGTKESFEKTFEEALRYNDSLEIYLSVIKMFATSGKIFEMEEKIQKLRKKEKQNSQMWLDIGRVYYTLQKFREARNIKEIALKSILDKKKQFDIILRFGIMEFQLGDLEEAIANFETILSTYPSKVNIWIIYVDQLVKRKNIECARNLLERAVTQRFGAKTMKILFQKYINFEKQHGTVEMVDKVKELAKAYVTTL